MILLDGGAQAYPRMLEAIGGAQRSVDLEIYAFSPIGIGAKFIAALGEAVQRGVRVNVTVDGWGSARRGRAVVLTLRSAGCNANIYHQLRDVFSGSFGRNHRKLLLVDDEIAFLGGINIGEENVSNDERVGWADLALQIRGPQCARLGAMIRGEMLGLSSSSLRIHLCGLGGGWRLRRRYLQTFARARHSICIAHGYFLPDPGVIRVIVAAARRGVRVELLLAGRSDLPFARAATRSLYRRLLCAGVAIYEWNHSVLHAKVATADGQRLLVGSFNLDPFSLGNLEALVEVDDPRVVHSAQSWIRDHIARSDAMTSSEAGSRIRRWFLDPFGHVVARGVDAFSRAIGRRRGAGSSS